MYLAKKWRHKITKKRILIVLLFISILFLSYKIYIKLKSIEKFTVNPTTLGNPDKPWHPTDNLLGKIPTEGITALSSINDDPPLVWDYNTRECLRKNAEEQKIWNSGVKGNTIFNLLRSSGRTQYCGTEVDVDTYAKNLPVDPRIGDYKYCYDIISGKQARSLIPNKWGPGADGKAAIFLDQLSKDYFAETEGEVATLDQLNTQISGRYLLDGIKFLEEHKTDTDPIGAARAAALKERQEYIRTKEWDYDQLNNFKKHTDLLVERNKKITKEVSKWLFDYIKKDPVLGDKGFGLACPRGEGTIEKDRNIYLKPWDLPKYSDALGQDSPPSSGESTHNHRCRFVDPDLTKGVLEINHENAHYMAPAYLFIDWVPNKVTKVLEDEWVKKMGKYNNYDIFPQHNIFDRCYAPRYIDTPTHKYFINEGLINGPASYNSQLLDCANKCNNKADNDDSILFNNYALRVEPPNTNPNCYCIRNTIDLSEFRKINDKGCPRFGRNTPQAGVDNNYAFFIHNTEYDDEVKEINMVSITNFTTRGFTNKWIPTYIKNMTHDYIKAQHTMLDKMFDKYWELTDEYYFSGNLKTKYKEMGVHWPPRVMLDRLLGLDTKDKGYQKSHETQGHRRNSDDTYSGIKYKNDRWSKGFSDYMPKPFLFDIDTSKGGTIAMMTKIERPPDNPAQEDNGPLLPPPEPFLHWPLTDLTKHDVLTNLGVITKPLRGSSLVFKKVPQTPADFSKMNNEDMDYFDKVVLEKKNNEIKDFQTKSQYPAWFKTGWPYSTGPTDPNYPTIVVSDTESLNLGEEKRNFSTGTAGVKVIGLLKERLNWHRKHFRFDSNEVDDRGRCAHPMKVVGSQIPKPYPFYWKPGSFESRVCPLGTGMVSPSHGGIRMEATNPSNMFGFSNYHYPSEFYGMMTPTDKPWETSPVRYKRLALDEFWDTHKTILYIPKLVFNMNAPLGLLNWSLKQSIPIDKHDIDGQTKPEYLINRDLLNTIFGKIEELHKPPLITLNNGDESSEDPIYSHATTSYLSFIFFVMNHELLHNITPSLCTLWDVLSERSRMTFSPNLAKTLQCETQYKNEQLEQVFNSTEAEAEAEAPKCSKLDVNYNSSEDQKGTDTFSPLYSLDINKPIWDLGPGDVGISHRVRYEEDSLGLSINYHMGGSFKCLKESILKRTFRQGVDDESSTPPTMPLFNPCKWNKYLSAGISNTSNYLNDNFFYHPFDNLVEKKRVLPSKFKVPFPPIKRKDLFNANAYADDVNETIWGRNRGGGHNDIFVTNIRNTFQHTSFIIRTKLDNFLGGKPTHKILPKTDPNYLLGASELVGWKVKGPENKKNHKYWVDWYGGSRPRDASKIFKARQEKINKINETSDKSYDDNIEITVWKKIQDDSFAGTGSNTYYKYSMDHSPSSEWINTEELKKKRTINEIQEHSCSHGLWGFEKFKRCANMQLKNISYDMLPKNHEKCLDGNSGYEDSDKFGDCFPPFPKVETDSKNPPPIFDTWIGKWIYSWKPEWNSPALNQKSKNLKTQCDKITKSRGGMNGIIKIDVKFSDMFPKFHDMFPRLRNIFNLDEKMELSLYPDDTEQQKTVCHLQTDNLPKWLIEGYTWPLPQLNGFKSFFLPKFYHIIQMHLPYDYYELNSNSDKRQGDLNDYNSHHWPIRRRPKGLTEEDERNSYNKTMFTLMPNQGTVQQNKEITYSMNSGINKRGDVVSAYDRHFVFWIPPTPVDYPHTNLVKVANDAIKANTSELEGGWRNYKTQTEFDVDEVYEDMSLEDTSPHSYKLYGHRCIRGGVLKSKANETLELGRGNEELSLEEATIINQMLLEIPKSVTTTTSSTTMGVFNRNENFPIIPTPSGIAKDKQKGAPWNTVTTSVIGKIHKNKSFSTTVQTFDRNMIIPVREAEMSTAQTKRNISQVNGTFGSPFPDFRHLKKDGTLNYNKGNLEVDPGLRAGTWFPGLIHRSPLEIMREQSLQPSKIVGENESMNLDYEYKYHRCWVNILTGKIYKVPPPIIRYLKTIPINQRAEPVAVTMVNKDGTPSSDKFINFEESVVPLDENGDWSPKVDGTTIGYIKIWDRLPPPPENIIYNQMKSRTKDTPCRDTPLYFANETMLSFIGRPTDKKNFYNNVSKLHISAISPVEQSAGIGIDFLKMETVLSKKQYLDYGVPLWPYKINVIGDGEDLGRMAVVDPGTDGNYLDWSFKGIKTIYGKTGYDRSGPGNRRRRERNDIFINNFKLGPPPLMTDLFSRGWVWKYSQPFKEDEEGLKVAVKDGVKLEIGDQLEIGDSKSGHQKEEPNKDKETVPPVPAADPIDTDSIEAKESYGFMLDGLVNKYTMMDFIANERVADYHRSWNKINTYDAIKNHFHIPIIADPLTIKSATNNTVKNWYTSRSWNQFCLNHTSSKYIMETTEDICYNTANQLNRVSIDEVNEESNKNRQLFCTDGEAMVDNLVSKEYFDKMKEKLCEKQKGNQIHGMGAVAGKNDKYNVYSDITVEELRTATPTTMTETTNKFFRVVNIGMSGRDYVSKTGVNGESVITGKRIKTKTKSYGMDASFHQELRGRTRRDAENPYNYSSSQILLPWEINTIQNNPRCTFLVNSIKSDFRSMSENDLYKIYSEKTTITNYHSLLWEATWGNNALFTTGNWSWDKKTNTLLKSKKNERHDEMTKNLSLGCAANQEIAFYQMEALKFIKDLGLSIPPSELNMKQKHKSDKRCIYNYDDTEKNSLYSCNERYKKCVGYNAPIFDKANKKFTRGNFGICRTENNIKKPPKPDLFSPADEFEIKNNFTSSGYDQSRKCQTEFYKIANILNKFKDKSIKDKPVFDSKLDKVDWEKFLIYKDWGLTSKDKAGIAQYTILAGVCNDPRRPDLPHEYLGNISSNLNYWGFTDTFRQKTINGKTNVACMNVTNQNNYRQLPNLRGWRRPHFRYKFNNIKVGENKSPFLTVLNTPGWMQTKQINDNIAKNKCISTKGCNGFTTSLLPTNKGNIYASYFLHLDRFKSAHPSHWKGTTSDWVELKDIKPTNAFRMKDAEDAEDYKRWECHERGTHGIADHIESTHNDKITYKNLPVDYRLLVLTKKHWPKCSKMYEYYNYILNQCNRFMLENIRDISPDEDSPITTVKGSEQMLNEGKKTGWKYRLSWQSNKYGNFSSLPTRERINHVCYTLQGKEEAKYLITNHGLWGNNMYKIYNYLQHHQDKICPSKEYITDHINTLRPTSTPHFGSDKEGNNFSSSEEDLSRQRRINDLSFLDEDAALTRVKRERSCPDDYEMISIPSPNKYNKLKYCVNKYKNKKPRFCYRENVGWGSVNEFFNIFTDLVTNKLLISNCTEVKESGSTTSPLLCSDADYIPTLINISGRGGRTGRRNHRLYCEKNDSNNTPFIDGCVVPSSSIPEKSMELGVRMATKDDMLKINYTVVKCDIVEELCTKKDNLTCRIPNLLKSVSCDSSPETCPQWCELCKSNMAVDDYDSGQFYFFKNGHRETKGDYQGFITNSKNCTHGSENELFYYSVFPCKTTKEQCIKDTQTLWEISNSDSDKNKPLFFNWFDDSELPQNIGYCEKFNGWEGGHVGDLFVNKLIDPKKPEGTNYLIMRETADDFTLVSPKQSSDLSNHAKLKTTFWRNKMKNNYQGPEGPVNNVVSGMINSKDETSATTKPTLSSPKPTLSSPKPTLSSPKPTRSVTSLSVTKLKKTTPTTTTRTPPTTTKKPTTTTRRPTTTTTTPTTTTTTPTTTRRPTTTTTRKPLSWDTKNAGLSLSVAPIYQFSKKCSTLIIHGNSYEKIKDQSECQKSYNYFNKYNPALFITSTENKNPGTKFYCGGGTAGNNKEYCAFSQDEAKDDWRSAAGCTYTEYDSKDGRRIYYGEKIYTRAHTASTVLSANDPFSFICKKKTGKIKTGVILQDNTMPDGGQGRARMGAWGIVLNTKKQRQGIPEDSNKGWKVLLDPMPRWSTVTTSDCKNETDACRVVWISESNAVVINDSDTSYGDAKHVRTTMGPAGIRFRLKDVVTKDGEIIFPIIPPPTPPPLKTMWAPPGKNCTGYNMIKDIKDCIDPTMPWKPIYIGKEYQSDYPKGCFIDLWGMGDGTARLAFSTGEAGSTLDNNHKSICLETPRPKTMISSTVNCVYSGNTIIKDINHCTHPNDPNATPYILQTEEEFAYPKGCFIDQYSHYYNVTGKARLMFNPGKTGKYSETNGSKSICYIGPHQE